MEEVDKGADKSAANYSRFLPIANIGRIMKKALPDNAKIAKDAKETVQECVSEFISFITSEACEKCKNQKRKTINGEDILSSIAVLGFEGYSEILKMYLAKYRESAKINGQGNDREEKEEDSLEDEEPEQDHSEHE